MKINLKKGTKITYEGKPYEIISVLNDLKSIVARNLKTGGLEVIKIKEIKPYNYKKIEEKLDTLIKEEFIEGKSKEFQIAKKRYEIIKPLLNENRKKVDVIKRAKEFNLSYVTLYRWIKQFEETETLESLAPKKYPKR